MQIILFVYMQLFTRNGAVVNEKELKALYVAFFFKILVSLSLMAAIFSWKEGSQAYSFRTCLEKTHNILINNRTHDHNLRKYLSGKSKTIFLNILSFTWQTGLMICR